MTHLVPECIPTLAKLVKTDDAYKLRQIAMQLHNWHERECGYNGGCVVRDEITGKTYWHNNMSGRRTPCRDMETSALKRLDKVMANYPDLRAYVQGDPRGPSLYILRHGDVPEGGDIDAYYSRGIAVYK